MSFSSGFDSRWSNSFAQCKPFKDTHSCWFLRKGSGLWGSSNTSLPLIACPPADEWVSKRWGWSVLRPPPPRTLDTVQLSHQSSGCFVYRNCVQKQLHSGIVLEVSNSKAAAGEWWLLLKGSISGQVCLSHHSCSSMCSFSKISVVLDNAQLCLKDTFFCQCLVEKSSKVWTWAPFLPFTSWWP